jgi:hypothetical protein
LAIKKKKVTDVKQVNFSLEQATKAQRASRRIALLFFNLDVRWVGDQHHATAAYSREKDPISILQEAG